MIDRKFVLIIDSILLFGALVAVFLLVGYSRPLAIGSLQSENENLLFEVPSTDYVLLDTSSSFSSPKTLFDGDSLDLKIGKYFIKFFNGTKSEIREIKFEVDVTIQFKKIDEKNFGFFNIGQNNLKIETYDTGSLKDSSLVYSGGLDE